MGVLTLTNLIPTIYEAFRVVARERIGFIPAVSADSAASRAAVGETIMSPVVGPMAAENLTAAAYAADTPAQTVTNVQMTISKARSVPFGITGEETRGLQNAGTLTGINMQRIAQALRTLTNEVEADLAALHIHASRAYGTYNGTPFGTAGDLSDAAQPLKILEDNGSPGSDLHMILDTGAMARLRGKQTSLFKVNESGNDDLLRRGIVGEIESFLMGTSAQVNKAVTVGTAASATTDATGYAVGSTSITLAAVGTGTLLAGDIITFAGDTNQYVVETGTGAVSGATIVLAGPGLMQALPASAKAITVIAATNRNMFFQRSAIQLITRAPAMPEGGDDADDVMVVTDPISGISFEFCVYKQKRQVRYEVNLAWGTAMPNPHLAGLLIGT